MDILNRPNRDRQDRWRQRFAAHLIDPPPRGSDVYFNLDISARATPELLRERALLRLALLTDPDHWGATRLGIIEAELEARTG